MARRRRSCSNVSFRSDDVLPIKIKQAAKRPVPIVPMRCDALGSSRSQRPEQTLLLLKMKGYPLYLAGLVSCGLANPSFAFTISSSHQHQVKRRIINRAPSASVITLTQLNVKGIKTSQQEGELVEDDHASDLVARRAFVGKLASVAFVAFSSVAATTGAPEEAQAAAASSYVPGTIWKTGKQPKVPGQKPKDKNDTSGTRKDGNFLRSVADCKSQCENSTGPDGYSRSKEECLSDCQDICCKTYEQCSFAIVPRI